MKPTTKRQLTQTLSVSVLRSGPLTETVAQHGAKENGQPLVAVDRFDLCFKLSLSGY